MANINTAQFASQYGVEVELLCKFLSQLKESERCSYTEMERAAGINVYRHRTVLNSARRNLLRESQMVFESVRGEGVRRLTNNEIAACGIKSVKKIGKAARRGIAVVSAGNYGLLSHDAKVQHSVGMTVLSMISHSSSTPGLSRIERGVTERSGVLPLSETLKLLAR